MNRVRHVRRSRGAWLILGLAVVVGLARPSRGDGPVQTPEERQKLETRLRESAERSAKLYREGKLPDALEEAQQFLSIARELYPESNYPDGHPGLAISLSRLGLMLHAMGQFEPALGYFEQSLAMLGRLYPATKYPDGHPDLAASLSNLGGVLQAMGRFEPALDYHEQALAMDRRLYPASKYPGGHPELARVLNNVGGVQKAMGRPELALDSYQQSLAMLRQLYPASKYPDGRRELATSLNNMGGVLEAMGRFEPALGYFEQSLAMDRRLYPASRYPDGHPQLATSLNNMGHLLRRMGRAEPALGYFEQSLAMLGRLYPASKYPDGHPQLATSQGNLGGVLAAMGRPEPAREHLEQALVMYSGLAHILGDLATEYEALAFQRSLPRTLDALLSISSPRTDASDRTWPHVWKTRSAVARIGEARHEALASGLPPEAREGMQSLLDIRRQLARLLLQSLPTQAEARADRDRRVHDLTEARERLERDLARRAPAVAQRQRADRLGPADLEAALPRGSAYVDTLRYVRVAFDPKRPGAAGETWVPHYVAFVVRPGQPVRRVELGPAAAVDGAVADRRQAVAARRDGPEAEAVRRLAWEPIARHLGPDTKTVYLVPDGTLDWLPWAALPGSRPGTVLLEDLAVAVVPHGPFLVRQLTRAADAPAADAPVLVVGGVAYDAAPAPDVRPRGEAVALGGPDRAGAAASWGPLKGTERELRLVCDRAGPGSRSFTGAEASTARLMDELPRARLAHLATHGFFNDAAFRDEQRRAAEAVRDWKLAPDVPGSLPGAGGGLSAAGAGARNPLSYTGLVLAGANHPESAGPDGGVLTGEMILGLDLSRLELAVLSACQTSLGAVADGQCVQNLQRAFHVAGCRDVVASLWDVPDESTAALMDAFYAALFRDRKPPLEALRAAQLHVYRNPGRPLEVAKRGAPIQGKAAKLPGAAPVTADPAVEPGRRAAVRDWAGFVLSGPGR